MPGSQANKHRVFANLLKQALIREYLNTLGQRDTLWPAAFPIEIPGDDNDPIVAEYTISEEDQKRLNSIKNTIKQLSESDKLSLEQKKHVKTLSQYCDDICNDFPVEKDLFDKFGVLTDSKLIDDISSSTFVANSVGSLDDSRGEQQRNDIVDFLNTFKSPPEFVVCLTVADAKAIWKNESKALSILLERLSNKINNNLSHLQKLLLKTCAFFDVVNQHIVYLKKNGYDYTAKNDPGHALANITRAAGNYKEFARRLCKLEIYSDDDLKDKLKAILARFIHVMGEVNTNADLGRVAHDTDSVFVVVNRDQLNKEFNEHEDSLDALIKQFDKICIDTESYFPHQSIDSGRVTGGIFLAAIGLLGLVSAITLGLLSAGIISKIAMSLAFTPWGALIGFGGGAIALLVMGIGIALAVNERRHPSEYEAPQHLLRGNNANNNTLIDDDHERDEEQTNEGQSVVPAPTATGSDDADSVNKSDATYSSISGSQEGGSPAPAAATVTPQANKATATAPPAAPQAADPPSDPLRVDSLADQLSSPGVSIPSPPQSPIPRKP